MRVFQESIFIRSFHLKVLIINKDFIARRNIDFIGPELNASQASIPASTCEVYAGIVPIDNQVGFLFLKVNKIDPSMTFTLLASSDNRTCYDGW